MKKKKIIITFIIIFLILIAGFMIFKIVSKKDYKEEDNKVFRVDVLEELGDLGNDFSILIKDKETFNKYIDTKDFQEKVDFNKHDYLLTTIIVNSCGETIKDVSVKEIGDKDITINIKYECSCGSCAIVQVHYLVELDKDLFKENPAVVYNEIALNKVRCKEDVVYKPIIYVYPKKNMDISIKLGKEKDLLLTYPVYKNSWNFYALTNGDLIDKKTNRKYYGLYWESNKQTKNKIRNTGFIVEKENVIPFLEEKLEILGLNEREANEFIIYWLPKLQEHKYNYIYFESEDEINNTMPLIINPKPDTIIRIVMEFKGLDSKLKIKEQNLKPVERKGYTIVEWGGTIIK